MTPQKEFLVNHIVDRLAEYLVADRNIPIADALKIIYKSKTYQQLTDELGELYIQSPSYVYELLKAEAAPAPASANTPVKP